MPAKRVLSIGQCMADHGSIARTFRQTFGAEVVAADTLDEALTKLRAETFALVLVNRVFDSDGYSGLESIQQIKSEPALAGIPVMLVSNYADAQAQAERAGAAPGFGKSSLGQHAMLERVRPFLTDSAIRKATGEQPA